MVICNESENRNEMEIEVQLDNYFESVILNFDAAKLANCWPLSQLL